MSILISDPHLVEYISQLAERWNKTPEQIVSDAIARSWPKQGKDDNAFWEAIIGIGNSGDPDLANRVKDILRDEIDPIEGWGKSGDATDMEI